MKWEGTFMTVTVFVRLKFSCAVVEVPLALPAPP